MRFDTGAGIPHAEIMIGDSVIMLVRGVAGRGTV